MRQFLSPCVQSGFPGPSYTFRFHNTFVYGQPKNNVSVDRQDEKLCFRFL